MICWWTDGKAGGSDETVNGAKSDTLGKANKQYSEKGRGDCEGRNYLLLMSEK